MNKVINIKYFRFLLSLVMIFGACCLQNSLQAGFGQSILNVLEESAEKLILSLKKDAAESETILVDSLKKSLSITDESAENLTGILEETIRAEAKKAGLNYFAAIDDFTKLKKENPAEFKEEFEILKENNALKNNTLIKSMTLDQFSLFLDWQEKVLAIDESFKQSLAKFIDDLRKALEKYLGRESSDVIRDLRAVDTPTANKILNDVLQKLPDTTQRDLEGFVSMRKIQVSFENQSDEYQDIINGLAKMLSLDPKAVDSLIDQVTPAINQLK